MQTFVCSFVFLLPPSVITFLSLFPHSPSLSSTPFQPSSASADGSGFNNNSRAWWGPSWRAHIHGMDSICLWMDRQLPIPRQLQLTEEGGTQQVTKSKRRDKAERGSHTRGRGRRIKQKKLQQQIYFMVCFFLF